MTHSDLILDRSEHPLDTVERLAATNEWNFDRNTDNELSVSVSGLWSTYDISFTWMDDVEAVHLACTFDLKVPEHRSADLQHLIALVNEQLWVGHFDLWTADHVVMFRHTLLLSGGVDPTPAQCVMLLKTAVEACDRYFQAFQFVLWAGKNPRDALDSVLFETEGRA